MNTTMTQRKPATALMDSPTPANKTFWRNTRTNRMFARVENKTIQLWNDLPSLDLTLSVPYSYHAETYEWEQIPEKVFKKSLKVYLDNIQNLLKKNK